ncbi:MULTISPECIES: response regulator [Ramlibacter]|uniref:Response regulator n=1 Tax=Ramlibacter pinisoli TaxID=2682844 RepID=A0A6N8ITK7_9BURK|nr:MULTISPECIES: response regulator [Ramlibacter]MBA2964400.1 response regulator [Ramlibacter sp. CGMCC 1.13660]MVQ29366.1 response regulator [Ramlibacter pinisoli]
MTPPLQRVLYVEDDADIRTIAVLALETVGGLQLRACASGAEALEAAAGFAPDLLLLDVMMPGMDGPTTLQRLRELPGTARTPVVFMTAKMQASEIEHYLSLGALGVITKPFDPMALAVQVQDLWRQRPAAGA